MKKNHSTIASRVEAEKMEGFNSTKVDAPETRFQDDQQAPTSAETSVKPEIEPFVKKNVKSSGHTLRQEVAAQALTGKGIGGAPAGAVSASTFGLKEISFSGDTGTILGNASGTPAMTESYQGKTRVDKRLSDANKDLNFNASEQIIVERDNIPPLAASESTVGYNGNPKNVAARSQKKTGYTPAEMLFDRSLDFIEKDSFVFSSGQVVKQSGVNYLDYPSVTTDDDGSEVSFENTRGNYSPRELKVTVSRHGGAAYISSFEVLEDDFSCNDERDVTVNSSATNHIIDMNRAELARQTIDADAGSPTSEHFNPLGRSVKQPTATVAYLQDVENTMGAEVFTSYRFANKARAHFLNRTAKDGQELVKPGVDALYGHLAGAVDQDDLEGALSRAMIELADGDDAVVNTHDFFNKAGMRKGSAAVLIPLFDSAGKYKTKGDLVNQPRGLKMHIQTADNNMNPFRVKKEFVNALNAIDAYSTIDHPYDPTAPVYITDNVRLIHPYSWASALKFKRDMPGARDYQSVPLRYTYAAGSGLNTYQITIGEPVLNGIAYFFDLHANELYDALKKKSSDNNSDIELVVPIVHSTTHFSLWDLLVCASTPYIIYERTNALKDILDYEVFYKYPLQGNITLAEANPLAAMNYGTISPYSQLTVKEMLPSSAMSWKYPEASIKVGDGYLLPYYFNEQAFDYAEPDWNIRESVALAGDDEYADGAAESVTAKIRFNGSCEHTTPVVRSGVKLGCLDDFFGMDVKAQLLLTDRMTRVPGLIDHESFEGRIYKYDYNSDGIPVVAAEVYSTERFTVRSWCATPRLLGWYFDAPAGVCRVVDYDSKEGAAIGELAAAADISLGSMRPSYRAKMYKGVYTNDSEIVQRPLSVGSVNVNRAQSFRQTWAMKMAGFEYTSKYFDLILSINEAMEYVADGADTTFVTLTNKAQFSPYSYGPYKVVNGQTVNTAYRLYGENRPILFSPHHMLWTLLQKLCFVINPFENSDDNRPSADPFGVAYLFGLSGFMSANYDEEIYNRANMAQNQGYGYTIDPMTAASVVFKDSSKYTGV